jgi:hypothetical protein
MQVKLTAAEAETLKQFRRLEPGLAKSMRNHCFRQLKAKYRVAEDIRLRVNLDTEVDPLYGVLLNAGTGEPIDDGVPVPTPAVAVPAPVRTGIWHMPVDTALAVLTAAAQAEPVPVGVAYNFKHLRVPLAQNGYVYFPAK